MQLSVIEHPPRPRVGAAEGCDLLILLLKKHQKIAACGSSYIE
jgi:hypothetical protein